ncbi:putative immunity protein, partial [Pseudoalteromonas marina]|uniref:putative immunity protein n=1 Tax=Pseudoalteromonas marina TaxID=267375 RepID=UPI003C6ABFE0
MKTTLNEIEKHRPCLGGWSKLLKSLNKTKSDDEELDLMYILKSNGIEDAVWALRCFDYLDYCLFLADVAESVLHIYERKNKSKAPRNAIEAVREYKLGKINKSQLKKAVAAAADAAVAAAADAAA